MIFKPIHEKFDRTLHLSIENLFTIQFYAHGFVEIDDLVIEVEPRFLDSTLDIGC